MPTNDPFKNDAFKSTSLTESINELVYVPRQLEASGLFSNQNGMMTTTAMIEMSGKNSLVVLPVLPRGGVGTPVNAKKRRMETFSVPHIPQTAQILADEVQDVREFGQESGLTNVQAVINERQVTMQENINKTLEKHRLESVLGNYYDRNGTLINLFTQFGFTQVTVNMALTTAATKLRTKAQAIVKQVEAALDGRSYTGITVYCSDSFFDKYITHTDNEKTLINYEAAQTLRQEPFMPFFANGINWVRYRGDSDVIIPAGQAYAVPTGVSSLFVVRFAPADYLEAVNTTGLPYYSSSELLPHNKGVDLEGQSNPLTVNTQPDAIVKLVES